MYNHLWSPRLNLGPLKYEAGILTAGLKQFIDWY